MAITMFTGSISAYAKSPEPKTIKCGSYKATCSLVTANKYSGAAITDSASKDKNKNKIKYCFCFYFNNKTFLVSIANFLPLKSS